MVDIIANVISRLMFLFLKVSPQAAFPGPLDGDEEARLFKLAKQGDKNARDKLIEHNLRLVAHIVKKYGNAYTQDDLMSIGTIGLIKAIDSFDPENGARFATYASKCLQNEILMYFRSQKKRSCELSINDNIDVDRDGNPLTYIDVIACDNDITEDIDLKIQSARAAKAINECLDKREREIIILRYGLGVRPPLTQREVAGIMDISRSYVSRIEKSALEKLRCALS